MICTVHLVCDDESGLSADVTYGDQDGTLDDIACAIAGPNGKVWEHFSSLEWHVVKVILDDEGHKTEIDAAEYF